MAKFELRQEWGGGQSKKVAESKDLDALRRKETELRSGRTTGSSSWFTVREK